MVRASSRQRPVEVDALACQPEPEQQADAMTTWSWWESSHVRMRSSRAAALADAKVAYSSRYRKRRWPAGRTGSGPDSFPRCRAWPRLRSRRRPRPASRAEGTRRGRPPPVVESGPSVPSSRRLAGAAHPAPLRHGDEDQHDAGGQLDGQGRASDGHGLRLGGLFPVVTMTARSPRLGTPASRGCTPGPSMVPSRPTGPG
jgi:hypothetical protein